MNKVNLASENSKAQKLVRKRENLQSLSKTNFANQQPQIAFFHNLKSNSVELVNSGGVQ